MAIDITKLSVATQATITEKKIDLNDGLQADEKAQLTDAEIAEITQAYSDAGIELDDNGDIIADAGALEETDAATATDATKTKTDTATKNDITMPADINIDAEKTAELKDLIKAAQTSYNEDKENLGDTADKIDETKGKIEEQQENLKKALSDLEGVSEEIANDVDKQVKQIYENAKNGTITKEEAKKQLGDIQVGDTKTELRNIEGIQGILEDLSSEIANLSGLYDDIARRMDSLATRWGAFLTMSDADMANVYVQTDGKIVINQLGEGGPVETGDGSNGISAADMQKFANMTNAEMTEYFATDEGKTLKATMQGMANDGVTLSDADCAAIIKNLIAGQEQDNANAADYGNVAEDKENGFNGITVNKINGVDKADFESAVKKVNVKTEPKVDTSLSSSGRSSCDPYVINIDGVEYTMILDNKDGKWDTNDILGINDSKDNLFAALKGLNSDDDLSSLTSEELQKAGIRLVAKNDDGTLALNDTSKDFDLSKVKSIDLANLTQSTDNDGNVGTFGHFNLTLIDGREIKGDETFEEMSTLQKLFGAVKTFFTTLGNAASDIISQLMVKPEDRQLYTEDILAEVTASNNLMDSEVGFALENSDDILDSAEDATEANIQVDKPQEEEPEEEPVEEEPEIETSEEDPNNKKGKNPASVNVS
ncbi:hypothetical protein IJG14_01290 [bacterium]|nr:hypothetical protein [bacterium]